MCHNTQYQDALDPATGAYDFSYVFSDVKYYLQTGDITVGNLETTFGGAERKYSSYPTFNTPDSLATTLKNLGFDLLSTANNHCMDTGYEGLCRTIDVLNNADIAHLGTYKTQEERDSSVSIQYAKGIKIAFVNYTYGTNGIAIPADKPYSVNLINKDQIAQDIQKAKEQNPDLIVAMMHWGQEYQTAPNAEQQELADYLFKNGIDIILGGHPHVLQPMEKRTIQLEDGTQKEGFIIYSQGNFSADQKEENTKTSVILNLTITKNKEGKISIDKAEYVPIYMNKNDKAKTQKFKLMDMKREIGMYETGVDLSIGAAKFSTLQKQLSTVTQILRPRNKIIGVKMKKILSKMRKAIQEYNMIEEGDKIAVCLSGGKDSISLLYALKNLQRFYPKHFEIIAISIDPGFEHFDQNLLKTTCQKVDVPLYIECNHAKEIVFELRQEKNPCSLCANMRRGIINTIAIREGCNKIALGHNEDDAIETFLLNLLYTGRIDTFAPVSYMSRTGVTLIRPLIHVKEKDTRRFIRKNELDVMPKTCPMDGTSKREDIKQMIYNLSKTIPMVRAIQRNIPSWKIEKP